MQIIGVHKYNGPQKLVATDYCFYIYVNHPLVRANSRVFARTETKTILNQLYLTTNTVRENFSVVHMCKIMCLLV